MSSLYSLESCSRLYHNTCLPLLLKKKEKKRYFLSECNAFCNFFFFFLVLPKFDVMITTPLYYSLREEDVTGVVTAK